LNILNLPDSTKVDKVIHKNLFDPYCNSAQKKLFTEYIQKILWTNKLSKDTIHLEGKSIQEIQLIKIELKIKDRIAKILNIIDEYMPYTIIFVIQYNQEYYISTSVKHNNPKNENKSIIEWTFETDWYNSTDKSFPLLLQNNLDIVYHNFCNQVIGIETWKEYSLQEIIGLSKELFQLEKDVSKLQKKLSSTKQFNHKVEINTQLHEKVARIQKLKFNSIINLRESKLDS